MAPKSQRSGGGKQKAGGGGGAANDRMEESLQTVVRYRCAIDGVSSLTGGGNSGGRRRGAEADNGKSC